VPAHRTWGFIIHGRDQQYKRRTTSAVNRTVGNTIGKRKVKDARLGNLEGPGR
jgi:hypothetical protein